MASGTISAKWYNDYSISVSWSSTPTTSSNSSVVKATIKLYCPYELYIGSRTGTIKINGVSYSFTGGAISGSGTFTLGTITSNAITHNNDGSKTVAISCSYPIKAYMGNANIYIENATCSGNATLDKIARAATLTSAPNFTDEANPTIKYSNPAGSSVSTLQACIRSSSGTIYAAYRDISKTGSSYTFNLTDAERKALRVATTGSNELSVRFTVKSVINGTTYYANSDKKMTIINGDPTISNYTAAEQDYITYTGSPDIFIKGENTVNVSMTVGAQKEATIVSSKIYAGAIGVKATSGTLSNINTGTIYFETTDSRGNTTKVKLVKTLINYLKPTIALDVGIPTALGEVDITVSGKVFSGSLGKMNNIHYAYYQYKEEGGSYNTWTTMGTLTITDNTYTATAHITGLDYKKKYIFKAYITDYFNTDYSDEFPITAIPVYDWGKNDFQFNVPPIVNDLDNDKSYNVMGLLRAFNQSTVLDVSGAAATNWTLSSCGARLIGNMMRININATRSAFVEGNITNETVCTLTINTGGKVSGVYNIAFGAGATGATASYNATGTTNGDTITITITLAAAATALNSVGTYFLMPVLLNFDAF